jgi:microcystin degradation protein MlrC
LEKDHFTTMNIVLAQFIFEGNSFSSGRADISDFRDGGILLESEDHIRKWTSSTESQMSGSLEILDKAGVEVHPVFVAICNSPSGRLTSDCYQHIRETLLRCLEASLPTDVIILHLHGAACAEGEDDVEGAIIEAVRNELSFSGKLVLSLDLHANVTRKMIQHIDALTAYRTMPHVDFVHTGIRAAELALSAKTFAITVAKISALIPPTDTDHNTGRFREILNEARQIETLPGITDVSLFPVQPWLDLPELGSSVVITAEANTDAQKQTQDLADSWYAQRKQWETPLLPWKALIDQLLNSASSKPWFLVDTADATTGGATGTSSEALCRLLPFKDTLPGPVYLWTVDPDTVSKAKSGAKRFQTGQPSCDWEADILQTGRSIFRARGSGYKGMTFDLGDSAVLSSGNIRLVATTKPCLVADPAFYESHGLDPNQAIAIQVKSFKGWQAGYGESVDRGLYFDGPGSTSLKFANLPYTGENRNLFPITEKPTNPIKIWE